MAPVAIVTDSTAYLAEPLLRKFENIRVVPLTVNFADLALVDSVANTPLFLEKLETADKLPTTSQPAPGDFLKVFQELSEQGYEIIAILFSSKLSGTVESALSAAKMCGGAKITVIDSLTVSAPLTFQVLTAATLAREGYSREEIIKFIETHKMNARVIFIPATLEYLHKGGRIGGAQALIGTLLQIKPVLEIKDGIVTAMDKVRSKRKALERLLAEVPTGIDGLQLAVVHLRAAENAAGLQEMLRQKLPGQEIEVHEISPVIATHGGPGIWGIGYWW